MGGYESKFLDDFANAMTAQAPTTLPSKPQLQSYSVYRHVDDFALPALLFIPSETPYADAYEKCHTWERLENNDAVYAYISENKHTTKTLDAPGTGKAAYLVEFTGGAASPAPTATSLGGVRFRVATQQQTKNEGDEEDEYHSEPEDEEGPPRMFGGVSATPAPVARTQTPYPFAVTHPAATTSSSTSAAAVSATPSSVEALLPSAKSLYGTSRTPAAFGGAGVPDAASMRQRLYMIASGLS